MKKYSTPDIYMLAIANDDVMVGVGGSGNVNDGPGDDIYHSVISSGGAGGSGDTIGSGI